MKNLKQMLPATVLFIMALSLGGCLESSDVTLFEPGEYKGAPDPLLGNTDTSALADRFAGQMDR